MVQFECPRVKKNLSEFPSKQCLRGEGIQSTVMGSSASYSPLAALRSSPASHAAPNTIYHQFSGRRERERGRERETRERERDRELAGWQRTMENKPISDMGLQMTGVMGLAGCLAAA